MNKQKSCKQGLWLIICASIFCGFITIAMLLFYFLLKPKYYITSANPLNVSKENDFALKTYNYDNLSDAQVTMRADIMNVTKRNLARPKTKLMGYNYQLPSGGPVITFPSYPGVYSGKDISSDYSAKGQLNYYKYMLLRQGMTTIQECVTASANNTLTQDMLFKHTAADDQYGPVEGENNAVEKLIVFDPSYRAAHPTGLYMPAGEIVTVKVSGLKSGEKVTVKLNIHDSLGYASGVENNYFAVNDARVLNGELDAITIAPQYKRCNNKLPFMRAEFVLSENREYKIGTPTGGAMHIYMNNCYSNVSLTFAGAVEQPHYILGVTTPEYFDTYLRNAPGHYSVLETENGQIIGPDAPFRKIDDPQKLAMLWHSCFAINETMSGGPYNGGNWVTFDSHVPAGAAVALGGGRFACPNDWYNSAVNYDTLMRKGSWGIFHEIGHGHASAFGTVWGFAGSHDGEVRNNAVTSLIYSQLFDTGTYHGAEVEHGFVSHPYENLKSTLNINKSYTDYNEFNYFECLPIYVNLQHSFGFNKWFELMYTYKLNSRLCDNKRADFAVRCAQTFGFDFRHYFNSIAKANILDEYFSLEQLTLMNRLPSYVPVANYFAGGIDGVKTAGDNIINFGEEKVFDLKEKMLSSENVEIIKVLQPKYGKLTLKDGKYIYTCPKQYIERDEFEFHIKQANGNYHALNVYLRFNYNYSIVKTYNNIKSSNFENAKVETTKMDPIITTNKEAGIEKFNGKRQKQFVVSEFNYLANSTGKHVFYAKGDDITKVYINNELKLSINNNIDEYQEKNSFTVNLQKGSLYSFKIELLNSGGTGHASLVEKNLKTQKLTSVQKNIYSSNFSIKQINEISKFKEKDVFMVSKKDTIKAGTVESNKSDWEVIKAPNAENGSQYEYNREKHDDGTETIIYRNKTDWLIDGFESTVYHSVWSKGTVTPMPHEYIIDTKRKQEFNYFKINTRHTADALIKNYSLFISDDNVNYSPIIENSVMNYKNYTAIINFNKVVGRYIKLKIDNTTGGRFSIISEIDAGMTSVTQQIIPATSNKIFTTKGFTNSNNIAGMQTGLVVSSKNNDKLVLKFTGDRIGLYAVKDKIFGGAKIKIDGKLVGEINLYSDTIKNKQLVFYTEGLTDGEHTLEVITNKGEIINLNYIGIPYFKTLLNASNIYLESSLMISLIVFAILAFLLITFVLLIYFYPPFRKKVLGDSLQLKLDNMHENNLEKHKNRKSQAKDLKETNKSIKLTGGKTKVNEDIIIEKEILPVNSDNSKTAKVNRETNNLNNNKKKSTTKKQTQIKQASNKK